MTNHIDRRIWRGHRLVDNPDYIPGCNPTRDIWQLKRPKSARGRKPSEVLAYPPPDRLPEHTWRLMDMLCTFDCDGKREYERGSVVESLDAMFRDADLEAFSVSVVGRPVFPMDSPLCSRYGYPALLDLAERFSLEAAVFTIAPKRLRPHAEDVIIRMGFDERLLSLEEPTGFRETVFCDPLWRLGLDGRRKTPAGGDPERICSEDPCGWMETDNGFVCFSDRTMWDDFCWLFGFSVSRDPEIRSVRPDFSAINAALEELPARNGKSG